MLFSIIYNDDKHILIQIISTLDSMTGLIVITLVQ